MHDRLFAHAERLAIGDLKGHARAIGLDGPAFDACLDAGRHEARWRRDLADAESYGSSGTPALRGLRGGDRGGASGEGKGWRGRRRAAVTPPATAKG
jgi:hypothetical protein